MKTETEGETDREKKTERKRQRKEERAKERQRKGERDEGLLESSPLPASWGPWAAAPTYPFIYPALLTPLHHHLS